MKLVIVISVLLVACTGKPRRCIDKIVLDVGGCDLGGYCGVSYTDGSYGTTSFPAKGKKVTVCK